MGEQVATLSVEADMLQLMKSIARALPGVRGICEERDWLRRQVKYLGQYRTWRPPGHFYSPIPALDEVRHDQARIFDRSVLTIAGVNLRREAQIERFERISKFYNGFRYEEKNPQNGQRYHIANGYFDSFDAIVLYCMIQDLRPKRIVEVGSGYSSSLMLDIRDQESLGALALTFIDPNPERLQSLLQDEDEHTTRIMQCRVQDVETSVFSELGENDILFIDSSHVSKTGSDVNFLFFDVLPVLKPGVIVHVHDVFFPFEYPEKWVFKGWVWNEAYLLRAFLQYNSVFQIELFLSYLEHVEPTLIENQMPRCLESAASSLWLRKTA